jgi:hypothetical protein
MYALEEVRLLCLILRCVLHDTYILTPSPPASSMSSSSPHYHLSLSPQQLHASQSLVGLLKQTHCDSLKLKESIQTILGSIYTPQNTLGMFQDSYINPVVAYICLRSVHSDGGFHSPKLLTTYHVKTQFGIRLYILEYIERQYMSYVAGHFQVPEIRVTQGKHGMPIVLDEEDQVTAGLALAVPLMQDLPDAGEVWMQ